MTFTHMSPDYSILHAKSIILPVHKQVELYLVGCGGTGSWLAPSLCRIARTLNEKGKATNLIFVDPDIVEQKNVLRQNFCDAEIGLNKAQTLALRYSLSWGVKIEALPLIVRVLGDKKKYSSMYFYLHNHKLRRVFHQTRVNIWGQAEESHNLRLQRIERSNIPIPFSSCLY